MTGTEVSGERRMVTALFCDVVGSMTIAETMDPADWSEVIGAAIDTMGAMVARFGGTVTEFGGDGIVALFGAPVAHEDDPYRAVSTAPRWWTILPTVEAEPSGQATGKVVALRTETDTGSPGSR